MQLAPTASDDVQVVDASWKPVEVESESPVSGMGPLFVSATFCVALEPPTPVVGKTRDAGCTSTESAAPPVPVRDTVAAVTRADELTVSAPVTTPFAVGKKTTPVEQLPPAARVVLHVF